MLESTGSLPSSASISSRGCSSSSSLFSASDIACGFVMMAWGPPAFAVEPGGGAFSAVVGFASSPCCWCTDAGRVASGMAALIAQVRRLLVVYSVAVTFCRDVVSGEDAAVRNCRCKVEIICLESQYLVFKANFGLVFSLAVRLFRQDVQSTCAYLTILEKSHRFIDRLGNVDLFLARWSVCIPFVFSMPLLDRA